MWPQVLGLLELTLAWAEPKRSPQHWLLNSEHTSQDLDAVVHESSLTFLSFDPIKRGKNSLNQYLHNEDYFLYTCFIAAAFLSLMKIFVYFACFSRSLLSFSALDFNLSIWTSFAFSTDFLFNIKIYFLFSFIKLETITLLEMHGFLSFLWKKKVFSSFNNIMVQI